MTKIKILGIIPARYASSRFPGKPLAIINGKSMIERVYRQASNAGSLSELIVATDDERIQKEILSFGGKVIITSNEHKSGTDRCYEVVEKLIKAGSNFDVIVNIQGDEPYIKPEQIDLVTSSFDDLKVQIATLVKKIKSRQELFNPNVNKVVLNQNKEAMYFSRNPIPYIQNHAKEDWLFSHNYFKHIGIYAYRTIILSEIIKLSVSSLEKAESLEQLRWLENGYKIKVLETEHESIAVDTPEDLSNFLNKS